MKVIFCVTAIRGFELKKEKIYKQRHAGLGWGFFLFCFFVCFVLFVCLFVLFCFVCVVLAPPPIFDTLDHVVLFSLFVWLFLGFFLYRCVM